MPPADRNRTPVGRAARHGLSIACLLLWAAGCTPAAHTAPAAKSASPEGAAPILIREATLLDPLAGERENTDILIVDERIAAVGRNLDRPDGGRVIDGRGRWVTPGLIDIHTHLGMASVPYVPVELETWDVNELSDPNTAQVRAEDAINPHDPAFARALAGGVTTVQVLPGSANLFGGRGVVLRNVPAVTVGAMRFDGAERVLKMACGENPKYTWGPKSRAPFSRMGIGAGYRNALRAAQAWREEGHLTGGYSRAQMEVLAGVLDGSVPVHVHCYRAHEMARVMDLAEEFGFRIAAFHHATEAYKIAGRLREHGACAVVWSDVWGFKIETLDAIRENAAFVQAAGACVALHSDLPRIGARMNIEIAKARSAGLRAGLDIDRAQALAWITTVPARLLGIDDRVGSVEPGKDADFVLWSGDPFSIRARAERVFIRGREVFEHDRAEAPRSDFELGQPAGRETP